MSIADPPVQSDAAEESVALVKDENTSPSTSQDATKPRTAKRPNKFRITMWIRRIHLYSGLFMFPWVLLYGFTALLFNHPTFMAGTNTTIEQFELNDAAMDAMPTAASFAESIVDATNESLDGSKIALVNPENAVFTRQAFGTLESEDQIISVILDLNSGKGYFRKRNKSENLDSDESEEDTTIPISGLAVKSNDDPKSEVRNGLSELLADQDLDSSKLSFRGLPNVEFDAIVDGEPVRLRLSAETPRRGSSRTDPSTESADKSQPKFKGKLSVVGSQPREMSARSFLLRLHMAHGYPVQTNARWFWAIAVDLMFASMCFWGISGIIMWWQIKRTRALGFLFLTISAIVATWLAIGMHWQLVNG